MARSASFRSRVVLKKVRWPLLSAVAPVVVLVRKRRDLGIPRPLSNVLAASAPLNVAAALPRGKPPTQRLQQSLRTHARVNWLDRIVTAVYAAWELEPHAALALVLAKRPERFAAAALRQGATF